MIEKTRTLYACTPETVDIDRRLCSGSDTCEARSRGDKIQIQSSAQIHVVIKATQSPHSQNYQLDESF